MRQDEREQAVTDEVRAGFAHDDRLAEVMRSLTTHLHAFAREVRLTQQEWDAGIRFLTRTGRSATTGARSSSCSPTCWACRC